MEQQVKQVKETKGETKLYAENLRLKKQIRELKAEIEKLHQFVGGLR